MSLITERRLIVTFGGIEVDFNRRVTTRVKDLYKELSGTNNKIHDQKARPDEREF